MFPSISAEQSAVIDHFPFISADLPEDASELDFEAYLKQQLNCSISHYW